MTVAALRRYQYQESWVARWAEVPGLRLASGVVNSLAATSWEQLAYCRLFLYSVLGTIDGWEVVKYQESTRRRKYAALASN